MTRRTTEHTATLVARDASGKAHSIDVYTEFIHTTMLDGATHRSAGMRKLRLGSKHVNVVDPTHLEVAESGLRLTLDQPLVP